MTRVIVLMIIQAFVASACFGGQNDAVAGQDGSIACHDRTRAGCPTYKLGVERLPDMNVPRAYHSAFVANGLVVVVGGHTTGFVPSATAEYLEDGKWHMLNTIYAHDGGGNVLLRDGKVLIFGGYKEELGIGQNFFAEYFNPVTRQFETFSCLDTKRATPNGIEVDSGRVVISGNWYNDDCIELFDGNDKFSKVKDVAQQRNNPFVFRTSRDNVVVFGGCDTHGNNIDSVVVDQLEGNPFIPRLFNTWHPPHIYTSFDNQGCFIGNNSADYSYLFPVVDSCGQMAIARLCNGDFSLLPTDYPVPMTDDNWRGHIGVDSKGGADGNIHWYSTIIADRKSKRAYLVGYGASQHMFYVLSISYSKSPAQLQLFFTQPLTGVGDSFNYPLLTPEGDLLLTGGTINGNFKPSSSALLLLTGNKTATGGQHASARMWLLIALAAMAVVAGWGLLVWHRKKSKARTVYNDMVPVTDSDTTDGALDNSAEYLLMQRIEMLMENERMYKRSDLKISDLAAELGTNNTYVSNCIRVCRGCSFTQFVNAYRIELAKQLMRDDPETKITAVYTEAGFSNETTFFRNFKDITGMTPKEWKASNC